MTEDAKRLPREDASEEEIPTEAPPEEPELGVEDIALLKTDQIRNALERARERDQYLDRLQRLQAEFDNYRKRVTRERAGWRRDALKGLVLDVLPVVDNFERALLSEPGPEGHADFVRGIELVAKQLSGVLEQAGLRPIEARGGPFDPARHEAVATVPSGEIEEGTVVEEVLKGYTMDDVVIRPTRVCVAARPAEEESPEPSSGGDESEEA